ncbi:MAG: methyltransferase domain-containing protein [Chlorobi bacterium]|nr:methyltransferase domain-containing protein [Chlorobiota bacterium]
MKEFWDERYKNKEYIYGKEPNEFFKNTLNNYKLKGKILFPAEGEGRNAVFAAKCGLSVVCFDYSAEAKKKAMQLAEISNVVIDYKVGEIDELKFEENSFDIIVLIYAHFSPELKMKYYTGLIKYLKPNGIIIIEAFSKNHLILNYANESVSGPKNLEMLFTIDEIKDYFLDFEILKLEEVEVNLQEGQFHKGVGSVIRFVGRKNKAKY